MWSYISHRTQLFSVNHISSCFAAVSQYSILDPLLLNLSTNDFSDSASNASKFVGFADYIFPLYCCDPYNIGTFETEII